MKPVSKMRNSIKELINKHLSGMAHKLDSIWHAFNKKNDENTEVAKIPIVDVYDTFLRSKKQNK
jgi:hypothetical protein